jgi:hypothetical protein
MIRHGDMNPRNKRATRDMNPLSERATWDMNPLSERAAQAQVARLEKELLEAKERDYKLRKKELAEEHKLHVCPCERARVRACA